MFFSAFGSSSSAHDAGHPRSQRPTAKSTDNDFARGRVIKWQRDAIICETVTPRPSVNRLILRPFASFATFCSNPLCFPSVRKSSLLTIMTLHEITTFLENAAIRFIRGVAIRSGVSRRTSFSIIVATIALAAILLCQLPASQRLSLKSRRRASCRPNLSKPRRPSARPLRKPRNAPTRQRKP